MRENKVLHVYYGERLVGTMALTESKKAAFEYDDEWLADGFSISPFSLPLEKKVFVPTKDYFRGLFGVFADSLPDAWGQLLLDRMLKKHGINRDEFSIIDRLAVVGNQGMGALIYRPERNLSYGQDVDNLDELAEECQRILNTEETEKLDELYRLGGTSGGARPKVMMEMDGELWIIKFPAHVDRADIGKMEYDYYLCAEQCGITMSECNLFPSGKCSGYFGTKRFDRKNQHGEMERVHMLTVAALLELDFEQPVLDYQDLMKLTKIITNNSPEDLENMYRRMCFNVYAHNRDDHAKNFSFLYEEEKKCWRLSPAYDLTYSTTYYGEHTTTVAGNGKNPGSKELIFVGTQAGLSKEKCRSIAVEIKNCVSDMLSEYLNP